MAIHRNGHAGHEGYIVLAVHDGQVAGIRGQHLFNLIHGIGEGFIVDVEIENVSVFQLWKVGEQPPIIGQRDANRITKRRGPHGLRQSQSVAVMRQGGHKPVQKG